MGISDCGVRNEGRGGGGLSRVGGRFNIGSAYTIIWVWSVPNGQSGRIQKRRVERSPVAVDSGGRTVMCGERSTEVARIFRSERLWIRETIKKRMSGHLRSMMSFEDVEQSVYLSIIRSRGDLPSASIRSWLGTIIDRRIVDLIRSLGTRKRNARTIPIDQMSSNSIACVPGLRDSSTPSSRASRAELSCAMIASVHRLPAVYRTAILMRYQQHASIKEIAEAFAKSPAAAKCILHRAKEMLRQEHLVSAG